MKLLQSKKGVEIGGIGPFGEHWAEGFAVLALIVSLIVILALVRSAAVAYLIAVLLGFGSGRYLEFRGWRFPYFLVVLGLLIGSTIGSRYGERKVFVFLFLVGFIISKWLHEHGKIK